MYLLHNKRHKRWVRKNEARKNKSRENLWELIESSNQLSTPFRNPTPTCTQNFYENGKLPSIFIKAQSGALAFYVCKV